MAILNLLSGAARRLEDRLGRRIDAVRTGLRGRHRGRARSEVAHITFTGDSKVGEVWVSHPAADEVFRKYHLEGCRDCPVKDDETLEELALGHGIRLEELLGALTTQGR